MPAAAVLALTRAKSYPFDIPARSYVYANGAYEELAPCSPMPDVSGRRAVLAVGSNQSPGQLGRKFKGPDWGPIPVIRASLADFDIVYSAHIASYGSIPSTLHHCPGTQASLFVNWLTPDQESHMHETEVSTGNYHFGILKGIDLRLDGGLALSSVYMYSSRRGALAHGGLPVALSEITTEGRRWPSLGQEEIQGHVRDRTQPGQPVDKFILSTIADEKIRGDRTRMLKEESLQFNYPDFTRMELSS
ncbi:MAG: hypothetical protein V3R37_02385 [Rhodospirillales bacterium]